VGQRIRHHELQCKKPAFQQRCSPPPEYTQHALHKSFHFIEVTIADVNEGAVDQVVAQYSVTAVDPSLIHTLDIDVFAPCALGAVLNATTIPELKARAVGGLTNNQLEQPDHGQQLFDRNIAYVPDFVVNAGGMMGHQR
jgi:leucine dehydrogenase